MIIFLNSESRQQASTHFTMEKKLFCLMCSFLMVMVLGCRPEKNPADLPNSIYSGKQGSHHVQGIAVDQVNGFVYYSFTDKLVKTDLSGSLIGSVTGFVGHLGSIDFDPETNTIYGSLEYKDDAIVQNSKTRFYIAMFDGSSITRPEMDGEDGTIMQAAYLEEVVRDYKAEVTMGDRRVKHRFGTSGIDGTTLGPSFGAPDDSKKYLYTAYGIYGDTTRSDNDHQVLLKYDIDSLRNAGHGLLQENPHRSGPEKPMAKYFIRTGNTRYGIQNLEYDAYTGNFFAAVYKGRKPKYPNYSLFVIDGSQKPGRAEITSGNKAIMVNTLPLLQAGLTDTETGIRGWNFKWGATGLYSLGEGLFYISHNRKTESGQQETTLYKYKWIGSDTEAFEL